MSMDMYMKLSNMEKELVLLIESTAEGLISELETVASANNLPTSREDLKQLAIQAIERL